MKDTNMDNCICRDCGANILVAVSTDLDNWKDAIWRFKIVVTSEDELQECCKEKCREAVHNCVEGVSHFLHAHLPPNQQVELIIQLPDGVHDND